jgi:hypothetical protein
LASLRIGPVALMQPDNAKEATITIPASDDRKPHFAIFMTEFNGLTVFKEASRKRRLVQNFPLCPAMKSVS